MPAKREHMSVPPTAVSQNGDVEGTQVAWRERQARPYLLWSQGGRRSGCLCTHNRTKRVKAATRSSRFASATAACDAPWACTLSTHAYNQLWSLQGSTRRQQAPVVDERTDNWSRYFALVPNIVIPSASTSVQRKDGSRSGLPSYSTRVLPHARPDMRKFHIIHPLFI